MSCQARKSLAGLKSELDVTRIKLQQPNTAHEAENNQADPSSLHGGAGNRPLGQWFLAGACLTTLPRARALPGRHFESFSGQLNDPIQVGTWEDFLLLCCSASVPFVQGVVHVSCLHSVFVANLAWRPSHLAFEAHGCQFQPSSRC